MDSKKEEERSVLELWQKRIEDGENHPAGTRGYCTETKIATSRFYYWRNKLKPKPKVEPALTETLGESFTLAEITEPGEQVKRLPDPRWLAAFAVEMIRGLGPRKPRRHLHRLESTKSRWT